MVDSSQPTTTWRHMRSDITTNLTHEGGILLKPSGQKKRTNYDLYEDAQSNKRYFCSCRAVNIIELDTLNKFKRGEIRRFKPEQIKLEFNPSYLALNDARTIMLVAGGNSVKLMAQLISLKNANNRVSLSGYDGTASSWFLRHGFSATEPDKVVVEYNMTRKEWLLDEEELHHLTQENAATV